AALDGIYVVRTNLPAEHSNAAATVRAYKSLSGVEHAFRSLKTVDLELRPVFHWTAPRVSRPRPALHAGLLSAMAHAPEPRPDAVRRARSDRARGAAHLAGGESPALTGGATQGRRQTHQPSRWRTAPGAQLSHPARRSRYPHPQRRSP